MDIAFGGCSSAGIKPVNEDAFAALQPAPGVRFSKGMVACLADGVSCSENAQRASDTSVTTFINDYYSTPDSWDVKTAVSRVLSSLNSWLYAQGQQSLARHNGLVTTFTGLVLKSNTAHFFHVGDSRIYRFRGEELIALSRDHCRPGPGGDKVLIRALGMEPNLKVDYWQKALRVGDVFMLTTDGVHEHVPEAKLKALLTPLFEDEESSEQQWRVNLETTARDIVALAELHGSEDNNSCLLLKVLSLPMEDLNEAHRTLTNRVIPPVMEPGVALDGFTIRKVLYNGVRSHIYLATQKIPAREVVIKVPSPRFAEDPEYLEGFVREQWVGRRINNPGVMKIFDPMPNTRFLYHVCEYVDGPTLRQWMYDHPNPPIVEIRAKLKQIMASLRAFQRMGMVHRDLKPENIMLTKAGEVKLIDFGTAQVSGLEEIATPLSNDTPVGTADYIAPEYLMGQRGSTHADLFSLGVIVYEMCTGQLPFAPRSNHRHKVDSLSSWQYRSALDHRPDLPVWVDQALKKACAPRVSQRYAAYSEFMHDMEVPNRELMEKLESSPVMERNPVLFWKILAMILLAVILVQFYLLTAGS